ESRRRRAVEAVVVVEDAYAHGPARMENLLECTKRAGNATEPLNLTRTAGGPAKTVKIPCGGRGDVVGRHAAHLPEAAGRFNHEGWLIALPPVRNGREIRGVGLNQNAVCRRQGRGLADVVRFR